MHRIPCSQCGHRLKYLDAHIGKRAKCQKCGFAFVIPAPGALEIPLDPDGDPSSDLVPMLEPVDGDELPPLPVARPTADLIEYTGYAFLLFGFLNATIALVVLANGPGTFGHGPNLVIPDEAVRPTIFVALTGVLLAGNGVAAAVGFWMLRKQRLTLYLGIVVAGLLLLYHLAYWFLLDLELLSLFESALVIALIWMAVQSLRLLKLRMLLSSGVIN